MDCPLGVTDAGGVFASLGAALRLGVSAFGHNDGLHTVSEGVSYGCLGHEFHFGCPSRADCYESTNR
jgi:hypothetical protein